MTNEYKKLILAFFSLIIIFLIIPFTPIQSTEVIDYRDLTIEKKNLLFTIGIIGCITCIILIILLLLVNRLYSKNINRKRKILI